MQNSVKKRKNESESRSDLPWRNWKTRLDVFQNWCTKQHSPLVKAWWSYLFSEFLSEAQLLSGSSGLCLDVGCGSGDHLCGLIEKGESEGIGLDPLKPSLMAFKDRIRHGKISEKVELILGVGEYLPIRGDSVKLCVMTGALDHVNNPSQTLRELRRVLIPDGHLMLMETVLLWKRSSFYDDTHVHQFTLIDLKRLLTQFRIEKILRKVPIFSQIHVLDFLLDYSYLHKLLSRTPGTIGSFFNHSEVLIGCRKN